jgi:hypothetical protein
MRWKQPRGLGNRCCRLETLKCLVICGCPDRGPRLTRQHSPGHGADFIAPRIKEYCLKSRGKAPRRKREPTGRRTSLSSAAQRGRRWQKIHSSATARPRLFRREPRGVDILAPGGGDDCPLYAVPQLAPGALPWQTWSDLTCGIFAFFASQLSVRRALYSPACYAAE